MSKLDPLILNTTDTLVNFANSILKHYGAETFHPGIEKIDKALKGKTKVAVFLFDGLGSYVLGCHTKKAKFMLSHGYTTIFSVNPPTTAAATTSLLTGKFPIETGWIGWAPLQKEFGVPVELFTGRNHLNGKPLEKSWSMYEKCPITSFDKLLSEKGVKAAKKFYIKKENGKPFKLSEMLNDATSFFKNGGEFLYSYWTEPDHTIHEKGVYSKKVGRIVGQINSMVASFAESNPDVLLFTIADHGLIDVENLDIAPYEDVVSHLRYPLSNEGRCVCFFVKEGEEKVFEENFKKHFPDFALYSKKEILESKYFGEGQPNPVALEEIGDFVAVSTGNRIMRNSKEIEGDGDLNLAHHAGGCMEEKEILVGAYNL